MTYDADRAIAHNHKLICEYSQNVLFHYLMILLWYLFVVGIVTSCASFIYHVKMLCGQIVIFRKELVATDNYEYFTFSECDYLQMIKKKDFKKAESIANAVANRRKQWEGFARIPLDSDVKITLKEVIRSSRLVRFLSSPHSESISRGTLPSSSENVNSEEEAGSKRIQAKKASDDKTNNEEFLNIRKTRDLTWNIYYHQP